MELVPDKLNRPIVGVSCCIREISGSKFQTVASPYLTLLRDFGNIDVILIPAIADQDDEQSFRLCRMLERLDGVVLTGSPSMIDPRLYNGPPSKVGTRHDFARDATTIPIARLAIEIGIPIFAICRGFQELCCAFDSTLEQDLSSGNGSVEHTAIKDIPLSDKYLPRHFVECQRNGILADIVANKGVSGRFMVNSLHEQGIKTLGARLLIEAISEDGLIEAISVARAKAFALGIQWHPEWHIENNPINQGIFERFKQACEQRVLERQRNFELFEFSDGSRIN